MLAVKEITHLRSEYLNIDYNLFGNPAVSFEHTIIIIFILLMTQV